MENPLDNTPFFVFGFATMGTQNLRTLTHALSLEQASTSNKSREMALPMHIPVYICRRISMQSNKETEGIQ